MLIGNSQTNTVVVEDGATPPSSIPLQTCPLLSADDNPLVGLLPIKAAVRGYL